MKNKKNRALQKKSDRADSLKLLRTSFQWLYAVIFIIFAAVLMFTEVFRVFSFGIRTENGTINSGVLVSSIGYSPSVGDDVTVVSKYSNFLGQVAACAGDSIKIGTDKNSFADCITYKNMNFFSSDDIRQYLKDLKDPKDYVLVVDIVPENGYFRVGEIVRTSQIVGKAECFVYPFDMLGKPVGKITEVH